MPSAPCFRMNAFWASENLDALHRSALLPARESARKTLAKKIQFSGSEHPVDAAQQVLKPRHRAGRLPGAGFANSWRSTGPAVEQLPDTQSSI